MPCFDSPEEIRNRERQKILGRAFREHVVRQRAGKRKRQPYLNMPCMNVHKYDVIPSIYGEAAWLSKYF